MTEHLLVQQCRRADVIAVLDTIPGDLFADGGWLADLMLAATNPSDWNARLAASAWAKRTAAMTDPEEFQ